MKKFPISQFKRLIMYTSRNCKILKSNFEEPYINLFQQYYIATVYGNELVMGSELIDE